MSEPLARTTFVLVGVLWAVRSLQSFTDPNFTDPGSAADWVAVIGFSLALAATPAGLVALVSRTRRGTRATRAMLVVATAGGVGAAIANVVEDGMGVDAAGNVYYLGIVLLMLTMLVLTGVLVAGAPRWPATVVLATVIGLILLESGGGVLILLAWGAAAVAVRPRTGP